MDRQKALVVLRSLQAGVHPMTGELFKQDSPYQTVEVIRALYVAIRAIESLSSPAKRRGRVPVRAGLPWTDEEDGQLLQLWDAGGQIEVIAATFERTISGIEARLDRHGRLLRQSHPSLSGATGRSVVPLLEDKPT